MLFTVFLLFVFYFTNKKEVKEEHFYLWLESFSFR